MLSIRFPVLSNNSKFNIIKQWWETVIRSVYIHYYQKWMNSVKSPINTGFEIVVERNLTKISNVKMGNTAFGKKIGRHFSQKFCPLYN